MRVIDTATICGEQFRVVAHNDQHDLERLINVDWKQIDYDPNCKASTVAEALWIALQFDELEIARLSPSPRLSAVCDKIVEVRGGNGWLSAAVACQIMAGAKQRPDGRWRGVGFGWDVTCAVEIDDGVARLTIDSVSRAKKRNR